MSVYLRVTLDRTACSPVLLLEQGPGPCMCCSWQQLSWLRPVGCCHCLRVVPQQHTGQNCAAASRNKGAFFTSALQTATSFWCNRKLMSIAVLPWCGPAAKPIQEEHAIVLVGYDNNKEFWVARNSWVSDTCLTDHLRPGMHA
jgi:hypothetical protein